MLPTLSIVVVGLAVLLGPGAGALEAQGAWGAQVLVDSWSSEESGTNLGAGLRRTGSWGRNGGFVFAANVVPVHLDTPEGLSRRTYLDLELGLLLRRQEWPVYAGWSIGYLYANSEGGAIGPADSGAQIAKLGWLNQNLFVEVQRWFGAEESTLAGEAKGARWVLLLGSAFGS